MGAARGARLDRRLRPGGARRCRPRVPRGGGDRRGARARALPAAPYYDDDRAPPRAPARAQAEVAAGEASWTLALDELWPGSTTPPAWRSSAATASTSSRASSETCSRRWTRRAHSASWSAARRGGGWPIPAPPASCAHSLRALLAMEAVGVGGRALELAIEYASTREQFGRRSASTRRSRIRSRRRYAELELARSPALLGRLVRGRGRRAVAPSPPRQRRRWPPTPPSRPASARSRSHGGIGFTWEHVLHRLYKRAQGIQALGGSRAQLRAEVADAPARRAVDDEEASR